MFRASDKVIIYSCGEGTHNDVPDKVDEITHDKVLLRLDPRVFDTKGNWVGGGGFPSALGYNFKIRPNYDID